MSRKNLITCAWPYANGSLHVGHVSALLPSDIISRFKRIQGEEVLFVSGTDSHGTPISVRAEKENIQPAEIAQKYDKEFRDCFASLGFSFSLYSTTTSALHKKVVHDIFLALYNEGFIVKKSDTGFYSEKDQRFLPDRFVEGICPYCSYDSARGDQCDNCGRLLDPRDLIDIKSKISGDTPIEKKTEHFYLSLTTLQSDLEKYVRSINHPRKNTKQFIENFLKEGLKDRAITRDLDWGISLPKELGTFPTKRIYVWFEAVCGYMSASKEWAEQQGDKNAWESFWAKDASSYYVYGKDNIPFHTIIWPAILIAYSKATRREFNLPQTHVASEYMQIEGKKLSTSRNWAVWIPDLQKDFSQDAIRYGLISLAPEQSDTNFSFNDFKNKFNNEFIATVGNYIQRILKLAENAELETLLPQESNNVITSVYQEVKEKIEKAKYKEALQSILHYGKIVNTELDQHEPWKKIKEDPEATKTYIQTCCFYAAQFGILLEPFLPSAAKKIRKIFGVSNYSWNPYVSDLTITQPSEILFERIEDVVITKHIEKLTNTKT